MNKKYWQFFPNSNHTKYQNQKIDGMNIWIDWFIILEREHAQVGERGRKR